MEAKFSEAWAVGCLDSCSGVLLVGNGDSNTFGIVVFHFTGSLDDGLLYACFGVSQGFGDSNFFEIVVFRFRGSLDVGLLDGCFGVSPVEELLSFLLDID